MRWKASGGRKERKGTECMNANVLTSSNMRYRTLLDLALAGTSSLQYLSQIRYQSERPVPSMGSLGWTLCFCFTSG
eukprot:654694-Amorphochlora_amoeboformis.AAC.1